MIGGYAVQTARFRGAYLLATVRDDADEARRLGAEGVHDTKGADAVLDLVNSRDTICRHAEILKPGGSLVSTRYATDKGWFGEGKIMAHNIALTSNLLSMPQGLNEVARMLADAEFGVSIWTRCRFSLFTKWFGARLIPINPLNS